MLNVGAKIMPSPTPSGMRAGSTCAAYVLCTPMRVRINMPAAARSIPVTTSGRGPTRGSRTVPEMVDAAMIAPIIGRYARPDFTGL